jgi:hypothetical protein
MRPPTEFPWQEGETFTFRVTGTTPGPLLGNVVERLTPDIEWEETTSPVVAPPRVEEGRLVKIPEDRIIRFKQRMERRKAIKNGQEAFNAWIMDQDWIHRPEAISKVVEAAKDMYEAENVDDHPRYIQGLANLMAAVREISRKNG